MRDYRPRISRNVSTCMIIDEGNVHKMYPDLDDVQRILCILFSRQYFTSA